jgi:3-oxoacyl-[acyl-carrier protein] reductase
MIVELKDKVAIVCGSTQGIGKAIAYKFAENNCKIILIARNEKKLKTLMRELPNYEKYHHEYIVANFERPEQLKKNVSDFFKNNKQNIHILVNNVGGPLPSKIAGTDYKKFESAFKKNFVSYHIVTNIAIERMKKIHWGRIINIIGTVYKSPYPGLGLSSVKAVIASWAKTLSFEVAPAGITVNNILPGPTNTNELKILIDILAQNDNISPEVYRNNLIESIPVKRIAEPDEIANAALFMASGESSYITGSNLTIDGGFTNCL